jgi:hypothetical protein
MRVRIQQWAGAVLLAALVGGCGSGAGGGGGGDQPATNTAAEAFTVATVHFEQNATDGDVEVVFEAKGGAEGLDRLTLTAPNGRVVADFTARDTLALGIRQFRFESPEPKDAARLMAAYPEGEYAFAGSTTSGTRFEGRATLSHALPATASFVRPAADAEGVPVRGLVMTWAPVADAEAWIVYIERGELHVTSRLPGSVNSFVVPDGFLEPGVEYTMGIGTVAKSGNASYVEASFTTAAGR